MPRSCVICKKVQGPSLTVFRFPTTLDHQASWVRVIREMIPDFAKSQSTFNQELKHGVCELHFPKTKISRGQKCRLRRGAVPSVITYPTSASKVIFLSESSPIESSTEALKSLRTKSTQTCENTNLLVENKLIFSEQELTLTPNKTCLVCSCSILTDSMIVASCSSPVIDLITDIFSTINREKSFLLCQKVCRDCHLLLDQVSSLQLLLKTRLAELTAVIQTRNQKEPCAETQKFLTSSADISENVQHPMDNREEGEFIPQTCTTCLERINSDEELVIHSIRHRNTSDCAICGRFLTSKARLKFHLAKFHGVGKQKDSKYQCDKCPKTFTTKAGLKYHTTVRHDMKVNFSCKTCSKDFSSSLLYRSHIIYTHSKKEVECKLCNQMFFTVSKLNTHVNAVHRNAYTWSCQICNIKFTTSTAFRHHRQTQHEKFDYRCNICSASFGRKSLLKTHHSRHVNYACIVCGLKFSPMSALTSHMKTVHHNTKCLNNAPLSDSNNTVQTLCNLQPQQSHMGASSIDSIEILNEKSVPPPTEHLCISDVFSRDLDSMNTCDDSSLANISFGEDFDTTENSLVSPATISAYDPSSIPIGPSQHLHQLPILQTQTKNKWQLDLPLQTSTDAPIVQNLNVDVISLDSRDVQLSTKPLQISAQDFTNGEATLQLQNSPVPHFILQTDAKHEIPYTVYVDSQQDA